MLQLPQNIFNKYLRKKYDLGPPPLVCFDNKYVVETKTVLQF